MIPGWVEGYLSIDYEKVNCWELVRKVYQDRLDIDVGCIDDQRTKMREGDWVDLHTVDFEFEALDVLLFKNNAVNRHVGLMLTPTLMLHTVKGANSCIENWDTHIWRSRLVGIYRHKSRCK